MIELGLGDLLGDDHGEVEPMSRADDIETDADFRDRLTSLAATADERAAIAIASGAELDDLGRHYGIRRKVQGIDGPPAA